MTKKFIWTGVFLIAIVGLLFLTKSGAAPSLSFEIGVLHPQDHVKGNRDSKVVLMEYSDFQCPACRIYYPVMRQITAEFGDRIAIAYRHFPLINIHPGAELAARAAEAAGKQGKFWEMHDLLFEKQNEWSGAANIEPMFESYASLIGISVDQFKIDIASKEIKDFVRAQRVHSIKSGLQGTPSFFINGKQIQNPASIEEFRAIIQKALNG